MLEAPKSTFPFFCLRVVFSYSYIPQYGASASSALFFCVVFHLLCLLSWWACFVSPLVSSLMHVFMSACWLFPLVGFLPFFCFCFVLLLSAVCLPSLSASSSSSSLLIFAQCYLADVSRSFLVLVFWGPSVYFSCCLRFLFMSCRLRRRHRYHHHLRPWFWFFCACA